MIGIPDYESRFLEFTITNCDANEIFKKENLAMTKINKILKDIEYPCSKTRILKYLFDLHK